MADGGGPGSGPVTGDEPVNGSARADVRSDAELLVVLRGRPADQASSLAFAALYDRHRDAARGLARQLARSPSDADDLVSAAFARLLEILRAGGGPTEAFRAYLLTSLRHLAYDRTRAERRVDLTEDMGEVIGVDPARTVIPFTDPAVAGLERSLAARAFTTLPERWQAVLWHLEVEGDSPADIAPLFGLTANAVSALGYRAREGLRQAYLQEHLAGGPAAPPRDRRHREAEEKLGAYTRGGLSKRDAVKVEEHLRECAECRALATELREVNSGILRSTIAPLVLGAALVGYLADRAAPGVFTGSWPTAAEWFVAGGGVIGVLGAVGGVVSAAEVPRARRLGMAAVGLAGLGVATATALGSGGTAIPEAAAPTVLPGVVVPGSVLPGAGLPGAGLPGAVLPGAGLPGAGLPGAGLPGAGLPGGPGGVPHPSSRDGVTRPSAPSRTGTAAGSGSSRPTRSGGRRVVDHHSGTRTHGASSSAHRSGTSSAHARPHHADPVARHGRSTLVDLRVLGRGADVRAARRGLLDPVLDVLLR
jgi:RNA polymerase sigma factor (sigma-70 family)